MATIQEVIEKVRKLRALSKSTNEHEAAAAAAAAERILQEHRLSEAQFEETSGVACETVEEETFVTHAPRAPRWRMRLISRLAHLHGCCTIFCGRQQRIIGRTSDIETVRYLYAWLSTEIARLAQETNRGYGRAWANAYRVGCVDGICLKMLEAKAAAISTATNVTSSAIVKLDARLGEATNKRASLYPDAVAARVAPKITSSNGYSRGREDGHNIHVGQSLSWAPKKALPS